MSHSGAGSAAAVLVTQEVVHAFVRDFSGQFPYIRASQLVVHAFVNDTVVTAPPATGVNTGTPVCRPYPIHLDRMCRVIGLYDLDEDRTVWTLPIDDNTLLTVVLSDPAFGTDNGKVLDATYNGSAEVYAEGDYSEGYVVAGRDFTMSVELSRPYRRAPDGTAITSDRLQHAVQYFTHKDTGDYTVRASMPSPPTRADRTSDFTVTAIGDVEEHGELRTMMSGWVEQVSLFVESDSPRPCAIATVKYNAEPTENQG